MKYREWLKIWLENYIKPCVRERTYMRYEQIIRIHLEPKIGDLQIKKITSLVLQTLITELLNNGNTKTKAGLSSNTVNNIIAVIQGSIKMALMIGNFLKTFFTNSRCSPTPIVHYILLRAF